MTSAAIPPLPRMLGFAGLLPQLLALAVILLGSEETRFSALALAYAYAALILSFIGGAWWGIAARADRAPAWLWVAAVTPSLLALASAWPWAVGGEWPGPSLIGLGATILASPIIDLRLYPAGLTPRWWRTLRIPLSIGLGSITIAIGLSAL